MHFIQNQIQSQNKVGSGSVFKGGWDPVFLMVGSRSGFFSRMSDQDTTVLSRRSDPVKIHPDPQPYILRKTKKFDKVNNRIVFKWIIHKF